MTASHLVVFLAFVVLLAPGAIADSPPFVAWLERFGRDDFTFPDWIEAQQATCLCTAGEQPRCTSSVPESNSSQLTFCGAKDWLLQHMPDFDLNYLPPSVSVTGLSMLDDTAAFATMADNLTSFDIDLELKLAYLLPYAAYHEARTNWRPLLFAKHVNLTWGATTTAQAVGRLIAPNVFLNWTGLSWDGAPRPAGPGLELEWQSSTNPPVVGPFEFAASGYGSCSAWATLLTSILKAVGIPARQAGTPCWDGGDFAGLAMANRNVTLCWHGGDGQTVGGGWLYNHNWVEFWDDQLHDWVFINVPPQTKDANTGLCSFSSEHGCDWDEGTGCAQVWGHGGPGAASQDHDIFAASWSWPGELSPELDGGTVIDSAQLTLSDGTPVSPLVWAPGLTSPLGQPLKDSGLRFVNRTAHYRCRP